MVVETSRSIAPGHSVARVNETTLDYWVKAYRERHAGDKPELGFRQMRLLELKRRNREMNWRMRQNPLCHPLARVTQL